MSDLKEVVDIPQTGQDQSDNNFGDGVDAGADTAIVSEHHRPELQAVTENVHADIDDEEIMPTLGGGQAGQVRSEDEYEIEEEDGVDDDAVVKTDTEKDVLTSLGQQLDFYFGESNYRFDRFLRGKEDSERYIAAEIICGFKKLKTIVGESQEVTPQLLLKSLITSDIVESTSKIGHDGNESIFFRRVEPLEELPDDPRPMKERIEEVKNRLQHSFDRTKSGAAHGIFLKAPLNQLLSYTSKVAHDVKTDGDEIRIIMDCFQICFQLIDLVKDIGTRSEYIRSIERFALPALRTSRQRKNLNMKVFNSRLNSIKYGTRELRLKLDRIKDSAKLDILKRVEPQLDDAILKRVDQLRQEVESDFNDKSLEVSLSLSPGKEAVRHRLERVFQSYGGSGWGSCKLSAYGSSVTGLSFASSDVDLCLSITSDAEVDEANKSESFSVAVVNQMVTILEASEAEIIKEDKDNKSTFVDIQAITSARVPILKLVDVASGVECDICINQHFGVHNSALLKTYTMIDKRVQPLILMVKHWATQRGISNSTNGSLSSYAWVIMVIHYLQVSNPPVLPNLQDETLLKYARELSDNLASPGSGPNVVEGDDVSFVHRLDIVREHAEKWRSVHPANRAVRRARAKSKSLTQSPRPNIQSISSLFIGFFCYYAFDFDFTNRVVSIHNTTSKPLTKAVVANDYPQLRPRGWRICIQDPFERDHDLGSVIFSPSANGFIYQEFLLACDHAFKEDSIVKDVITHICCPCDAVQEGTVDCFHCGLRGHFSARCPERGGGVENDGKEDSDSVGDDNPKLRPIGRPEWEKYAPLCFKCGDTSHSSVNCPLKDACFICGELGHKSSKCPVKVNRKLVSRKREIIDVEPKKTHGRLSVADRLGTRPGNAIGRTSVHNRLGPAKSSDTGDGGRKPATQRLSKSSTSNSMEEEEAAKSKNTRKKVGKLDSGVENVTALQSKNNKRSRTKPKIKQSQNPEGRATSIQSNQSNKQSGTKDSNVEKLGPTGQSKGSHAGVTEGRIEYPSTDKDRAESHASGGDSVSVSLESSRGGRRGRGGGRGRGRARGRGFDGRRGRGRGRGRGKVHGHNVET